MNDLAGYQAPPRWQVRRLWHFADAVLDERTLELRVAGSAVTLPRKQLEILLYLLRNADRVVFKSQLFDAIWPGRVVTDSNLTKCVAALRHAIADREQTIIKTIHGYGYRLAAHVSVESEVAQPRAA